MIRNINFEKKRISLRESFLEELNQNISQQKDFEEMKKSVKKKLEDIDSTD